MGRIGRPALVLQALRWRLPDAGGCRAPQAPLRSTTVASPLPRGRTARTAASATAALRCVRTNAEGEVIEQGGQRASHQQAPPGKMDVDVVVGGLQPFDVGAVHDIHLPDRRSSDAPACQRLGERHGGRIAQSLHGARKALRLDRFQQVVDRVGIECTQRIRSNAVTE